MRKRHLLLRAASIVEKVNPDNFGMSALDSCTLHYIRNEPGFEKLNHAIKFDDYFAISAARFFGISTKESESLFGGHLNFTPKRAASALRRAANKEIKKPGTIGMKVVRKAVKEALAVPTRQTQERV